MQAVRRYVGRGGRTQLFFKNATDYVQFVPNPSSFILRASPSGLFLNDKVTN